MRTIFSKKKYFIGITTAVILCILAFGSYVLLRGSDVHLDKYSKDLTWYGIDVNFNPQDKKLYCQQRVNYINDEDDQLTEIYFHIYPNSFKYESKPVFPQEEMSRAYPNGFSPGSIEFEDVLLDGDKVFYEIDGYSDDILMINLEEPLKPKGKIDIWLEYSIEIPNSPGRFGYFNNTYNLGNWYPILCVYDETGWNLEPYYSMGDPFYSDVSNYKVSITAPQEFEIAATGDRVNIREEGNLKVWEFESPVVRDFAWVGSDEFQVSSMKMGETTVYSYHYSQDGGEKALDYGASALRIFNELFGIYPYKTLSIVQTGFFIGGMEYPRLVMIDDSLYDGGQDEWLETVTVHEVAHQWWYGLIGNDQVHDSWLDEALAEYSTILYYGKRYGSQEEYSKYQDLVNKGKYQLFRIYRDSEDIDETIHRPLYEFEDWIEYDSLVYGKGAILFHEIRQEMGDEVFLQVLKKYFRDNIFKNVKPEDLYKSCQDITGQSWEEFFKQWLYDN